MVKIYEEGESLEEALSRLRVPVSALPPLLTRGGGPQDLETRGRTYAGYHDISWYQKAIDQVSDDIEKDGLGKTVAKYGLAFAGIAATTMYIVNNVMAPVGVAQGGGGMEDKLEAYLDRAADPCLEKVVAAALQMANFDPDTGELSADDLARLMMIVAQYIPNAMQQIKRVVTSKPQLTYVGGAKRRNTRRRTQRRRSLKY